MTAFASSLTRFPLRRLGLVALLTAAILVFCVAVALAATYA
jgi:hypothetical protein